jgi:hypothetical protein
MVPFERVLRINPDGNIVWARRISEIYASAVFETSVGRTALIGVDNIVHLDPSGDVVEDLDYYRSENSPLLGSLPFNQIQSLERLSNGNILALSGSGIATVLNSDGHVISQKGVVGGTTGPSVRWMSSNTLWLGGLLDRNTNWIERRSATGNSWRVELVPDLDVPTLVGPFFVLGTSDGGVLFGSDVYPGGAPQLWMIRLDLNGALIWQYVYGVDVSDIVVQETGDHGFLLSGWRSIYDLATPNEWGVYLWLARFEPSGQIRWTRLYGDGINLPIVSDVLELPSGELYFTGQMGMYDGHDLVSAGNVVLMRTNSSGEIPGCNWMQQASERVGVTLSPEMQISSVPTVEWIEEELTSLPGSSDLDSSEIHPTIRQICSSFG